MRIKSILTMAMVALVMTNCNQEEYQEEILQIGVTEFTAGVEGQSRSTMTDAGNFSWTKGDQISVWNGSTFKTFTCSNGSTFTGDPITPSKYAVYPAGNHSVSGNSITVNLPSSYGNTSTEYVQNTNAIMLASVQSGNSNLTFNHLGGLMRFNVKNVPAGANQFVFTASNKDITGDFTVNNGIITANSKSSKNTVSINFKSSNTTRNMTFYIPLPTGTYNGFKIEIRGNSTLSFTSDATNTVNRRTLLLMPAFECKNGSLKKEGSTPVDFSNNSSTTTTIATESVEVNTSTATSNNSSATLSYDPNNNPTLNISDDNKGEATQESKATVNVAVPANSNVTALTVDAPTLTIELSTESGSATYETVTAKTASNTLKIKNGITVKRLILNGGHIVIESGAKVDKIENANGYNEKTYIYNKGTITDMPSLPNVEIVDYVLRVLTFEDKDAKFESYYLDYYNNKQISTWSDLIAEDQYGDYILGYGTWAGECIPTEDSHYSWYDENNTFLAHNFPLNYDSYCFAGGGHAISNYASNDYSSHGDYTYQLTIYDKDANGLVRSGGGHNCSDNFAIHYGYYDGSEWNQTTENDLPAIYFKDDKARVIDHLWVCLSTYEYYCLYEGNGLTEPLGDGDYVIIEAIGHKEDGTTSKISTRVADLQNGVIDDWTKWDLSSLGKVKKVHFNIIGTNDNGFGFSQPAYFAYDDVAVQFTE